ncbi:hypothetical protein GCM10028816_47970 [Spirosoma lituiforme]
MQRLCAILIRVDPINDSNDYEETFDQLVAKTSYFAEFTSIVKQAIAEKLPYPELLAAIF